MSNKRSPITYAVLVAAITGAGGLAWFAYNQNGPGLAIAFGALVVGLVLFSLR